jgi:hypothetical protein
METAPKNLTPSITLDFQFVELLAIKHVKELEFFKGHRLTARAELDYNDQLTGGIIVSCESEEA